MIVKRIKQIFPQLILSLVLTPLACFAVNLDVQIFSDANIKSVTFTSISGKYGLYDGQTRKLELFKNSSLIIKVVDGKVGVYRLGELIGTYTVLNLKGEGFVNAFSIAPENTNIPPRVYDDNLRFVVVNKYLRIINSVDIERYVAGVVQSEGGGSSKEIEFFYVQSIICRTYALNNHRKHMNDGFHLCDAVHCQVYKGRCSNADIMMAVTHTMGEVVVDAQKRMISAAFHSNCGGQTTNSEDVWSIPTTYLRSVGDSFCTQMRNASWSDQMPLQTFVTYLQKNHNFPTDTFWLSGLFPFIQNERAIFFADSVPLKVMRTGLRLRSTFFNIERNGDQLIFKGRGYGHGVGLCQEGAIRMAERGFAYKDIIKHYYKGVEIVNYLELKHLIQDFIQNSESP